MIVDEFVTIRLYMLIQLLLYCYNCYSTQAMSALQEKRHAQRGHRATFRVWDGKCIKKVLKSLKTCARGLKRDIVKYVVNMGSGIGQLWQQYSLHRGKDSWVWSNMPYNEQNGTIERSCRYCVCFMVYIRSTLRMRPRGLKRRFCVFTV